MPLALCLTPVVPVLNMALGLVGQSTNYLRIHFSPLSKLSGLRLGTVS